MSPRLAHSKHAIRHLARTTRGLKAGERRTSERSILSVSLSAPGTRVPSRSAALARLTSDGQITLSARTIWHFFFPNRKPELLGRTLSSQDSENLVSRLTFSTGDQNRGINFALVNNRDAWWEFLPLFSVSSYAVWLVLFIMIWFAQA